MRTLPVCLSAFCEGLVVEYPTFFSSAPRLVTAEGAVYAALVRIRVTSVVPRPGLLDIDTLLVPDYYIPRWTGTIAGQSKPGISIAKDGYLTTRSGSL